MKEKNFKFTNSADDFFVCHDSVGYSVGRPIHTVDATRRQIKRHHEEVNESESQ